MWEFPRKTHKFSRTYQHRIDSWLLWHLSTERPESGGTGKSKSYLLVCVDRFSFIVGRTKIVYDISFRYNTCLADSRLFQSRERPIFNDDEKDKRLSREWTDDRNPIWNNQENQHPSSCHPIQQRYYESDQYPDSYYRSSQYDETHSTHYNRMDEQHYNEVVWNQSNNRALWPNLISSDDNGGASRKSKQPDRLQSITRPPRAPFHSQGLPSNQTVGSDSMNDTVYSAARSLSERAVYPKDLNPKDYPASLRLPSSRCSTTELPSLADSPLFRKSRPRTADHPFCIPRRSGNVSSDRFEQIESASKEQVMRDEFSILQRDFGQSGSAVQSGTPPANKRHSENGILPALKHQISSKEEEVHEPLDFETLLEETLKNEGDAMDSNATETGINKSIVKRKFLKKGARNPITTIPESSRRPKYPSKKKIGSTSLSNDDKPSSTAETLSPAKARSMISRIDPQLPPTIQTRRASVPAPPRTAVQRRASVQDAKQTQNNSGPIAKAQRVKVTEGVVPIAKAVLQKTKFPNPKRGGSESRMVKSGAKPSQPNRGQLAFPLGKTKRAAQRKDNSSSYSLDAESSPLGKVVVTTNNHSSLSYPKDSEFRPSSKSSLEEKNSSNSDNLVALMTTVTGGGQFCDELDEIASSRNSVDPLPPTDQFSLNTKGERGRAVWSPLVAKSKKRGKSPVDLLDELDGGKEVVKGVNNNNGFRIPDPTTTLFGCPGESYGEMKRRELQHKSTEEGSTVRPAENQSNGKHNRQSSSHHSKKCIIIIFDLWISMSI